MKPLLYNVTIKVSHAIQADWLQWMQEEHLPEVVGTGCFTSGRLLQLIESDDEEGVTYAAQYEASSRADYDRYIREYADALRKKGYDRWGDGFIAFRTLMQVT
jgi:hypothetical protein